jgi:ABC-type bacteriocin/lantibiotic exporter with double-glycine peptidase domain
LRWWLFCAEFRRFESTFEGSFMRLLAALLLLFFSPPLQHAAQTPGIWLQVPYVKQTEEGCGSASLAMLLQYWSAHGATVAAARSDAAVIQKQLYSRKAHGIFASEMERYLRESGFREFAVRGEWSDLRQHLAQGRPLIISIQPGNQKVPLHYVVVTGMDWQREAVFVHDPARGELLRIERPDFERQWQAARNWMLLAVPAVAP